MPYHRGSVESGIQRGRRAWRLGALLLAGLAVCADGAAEGAGVDPLALFAGSIEEIWGAHTPPEVRGGGSRRLPRPRGPRRTAT